MSKPTYSKSIPPPSINIPNLQTQPPNFLSKMVQGMALGTGSSIGNKIVDTGFTGKQNVSNNENNCNDLDNYIIGFNKCMVINDNNFQECIPLLDIYVKCIHLFTFQTPIYIS
jgi:hypothetical protein